MELVIRLAVRVAIIKHIRAAITQAHITSLDVTARALQYRVDCRQCLRRWHAPGELFLHQPPDFLCANGSWYASRQAHAFEEAIEHKGIRRTDIRLAIGNIVLVMRKRRTPSMHEQVAGWQEGAGLWLSQSRSVPRSAAPAMPPGRPAMPHPSHPLASLRHAARCCTDTSAQIAPRMVAYRTVWAR